MVTNIPTGNPEVDGKAHAKLRVDKTNEAWKGDSGGWSGHPAFSPYVRYKQLSSPSKTGCCVALYTPNQRSGSTALSQ